MFNRRGKSLAPTIGVVLVLVIGIYVYYMYSELRQNFEEKERKLNYLTKRQVSLKSQLQVVYEHRTKLEAALLKQRTDHRATKHEFVHKMKECAANLTRSKQEATNRFNALDTEHRMQKARHEEVTGDFDRLQQQYVRLTKDHQKIIEGHKEDFQKLRDSKMHESKSLQERVKVLFGEKESCLTQKTKYIGFYHSEKTERLRLTDSVLMIKKTLQKEKTRADEAEESLMDYQKKLELAEKKIEELEKKTEGLSENQAKPTQTGKDADVLPTPGEITEKPQENRISTVEMQLTTGSPYRLATNAQHQDEASKAARVARTSSLLTMPSAKVQGMIIGKPGQEEMDRKREDSIKDQYEVTEPSERDENKMEGMVTTTSHGEVPFQGLARRKLAIGRKRAKERKAAKATEDDASEITKKEEHGSEAGNTKEDYENEAKKNGDVNADNDDRMKYGKGQKKLMKSFIVPRAKADVTAQNKEEGVEETNARKAGKVTRDVIDEDESLPKKIDDETSMLKRQQQLLHRPIPKIDSEASKRETANENEDEENRDGNAVETEKRGTAEEMDQDETVAKEMAEKRKELSDEDKDEKEKDAVEEGNATKSESKDKERNIEEEEEGVNGDEEFNNENKKSGRDDREDEIKKKKKGDTNEDQDDSEISKESDENAGHKINEDKNKKILQGKIHNSLLRHQLKPPKPMLPVRSDVQKQANQKPAQARRQLQPPVKKNAQQLHPDDDKIVPNQSETKGKVDSPKVNGLLLHAPIKRPNTDAAVRTANVQNLTPSHSLTHEDDENGDQDLDRQKPDDNGDNNRDAEDDERSNVANAPETDRGLEDDKRKRR